MPEARTKRGTLKIRYGSTLKFVFFDGGAVIYASSNDPVDKLGNVLLEEGKITQDQYQMALQKKEKAKTLGRTLVDLGFLSSRELMWDIGLQVRKIVRGLVNLDKISILFEKDNLPANTVQIEIPAERMLVDALLAFDNRRIL